MVQRPAGEPLQREDPEDLVAVHQAARGIHGHAPVGIAIKREADVRPVRADRRHEGLRLRSRRSRG